MGAASAILTVLAFAFLAMGIMDYYSSDQVDDKEFAAEMRKLGGNKQSLITGAEDSLPESMRNNGNRDPE